MTHYCSYQILTPETHPQQRENCINSGRPCQSVSRRFFCGDSSQSPRLYALQHTKNSSKKLTGNLKFLTGVISGVVTPKDKTKSNPLANQKDRHVTKFI